MSTIPNAKFIGLSSPYAKRGELWRAYRRYFGKENAPVLVWQADTRTMNPAVPQSLIDDAYERDPVAAAAEYGAQFRSDIESVFTTEQIEACTRPSPLELPYSSEFRYSAFTDPSGGSSDSFTLCIGHQEKDSDGEHFVVDVLRERKPPFSPEAVVADYAELLREFRISTVIGDRYAGEWPVEAFNRHRIRYEQSAKPKSDLYKDFLSLVNGARVELPPMQRLAVQLTGLERRTARGGRDSIDHPPGSRDDISNVVAGAAAVVVSKPRKRMGVW